MLFLQTLIKSYYMLLNCTSCLKKFAVPDSAIGVGGRLVQCGSCGNKWTQYPIREDQKIKSVEIKSPIKIKKKQTMRKKREVSLYSKEYLKKKYGLSIKDSNKPLEKREIKNNFGFYNYLITVIILLLTIYGLLNLSKDIIILKYPFTESYINYFYEVIDIVKIIISELINQFTI